MIAEDGTIHNASTYRNHDCKCDICKQANLALCMKSKEARYSYTAVYGLPDGREHGVNSYKNWGCRCGECTDAYSAYNSESYQKRKARKD